MAPPSACTRLPCADAVLIDVLRDRRRAHEAHRGDVGIRQQRVDRDLIAVDHVEHARRQAGFGQQLREPQRAARILLRRLQHEGVAARDGDRKHPQRHHRREIERRDPRADSHGLPQRPRVDAAAHGVRELTFQQMRNAARELDNFDAARDFAARIGKHLAMLAA